MKLNVTAKTDVGLLSDHNEDYFVARRELDLYMVADGVGGGEAGELASQVGCQLLEQALRTAAEREPERARHALALAHAVAEANRGLFTYGQHHKRKSGLGTTISALWFHGDRVLFAYVGDSRIYLYRNGRLLQLSSDQKAGKYRLAASLGHDLTVEPGMGMVRLRQGDRFLLCTDGLYGPVPHDDITTILDSQPMPAECCDRLVAKANQCGGPDNITVLVADVAEADLPEAWRFMGVWFDATSLPGRLLRAPKWLGAVAVGILVGLVVWGAVSLGSRTDGPPLPRIRGRLAVLAAEASEKARAGDQAGTLQALKDFVREAVNRHEQVARTDLALDARAEPLYERAADSVWAECYEPARQKLAALEGTPAEAYAEAALRATRERLDLVHKQFRNGDYRSVAGTFATLEKEVETIAERARGDLAREKERLAEAIRKLQAKVPDFEPSNPLRRSLEAHLEAAAKALEADRLTEARKHIEAADAELSGTGPEEEKKGDP